MKRSFLLMALIITSVITFSQNNIDLLILNKQYNLALGNINNKLNVSPSAELYYKKGLVLNSLQKYQKALGSFTEALQLDTANVEIIVSIAEDLSVLGNNREAVKFYRRAIGLSPDNLTIAAKLGRVYINRKDYKNAYSVFSNIYQKDSSNVFWNKQLAYSAFRTFKREEAVRLYEKIIESNPNDYGSYLNLIHSYNTRKEKNKISAVIEIGLKRFPGDAGLYLEKANFHFKQKFYPSAMVNFQNYFRAGGDSIQSILLNYAISTYFSNDYDKALEILNGLFSQNPNDVFVMFYISLCKKKQKDFAEAEKFMRWAIDSSIPDYISDMYYHLGQILGQQRKFKESVEALKNAYKYNNENYNVLFEIATTYEEFNSNKTMALNYYRLYLKDADESDKNVKYALDRVTKIKEDLFFDE